MLDTEFIKQHVERRERIDRRQGDDTIIRLYDDRRRIDRRSHFAQLKEDSIRFTKKEAFFILLLPVTLTAYLIYKIVTI